MVFSTIFSNSMQEILFKVMVRTGVLPYSRGQETWPKVVDFNFWPPNWRQGKIQERNWKRLMKALTKEGVIAKAVWLLQPASAILRQTKSSPSIKEPSIAIALTVLPGSLSSQPLCYRLIIHLLSPVRLYLDSKPIHNKRYHKITKTSG